ncbi:MAG: hypothetical protein JW966_16410 [Anaerolineae bacterium]|nr:hypothetical protein [Anaerolineae bacterium]
MNDTNKLDDDLATWTDNLLTNQPHHPPDDIADLAGIVQQFHDLVAPHETPDPAFEHRLTQRLKQEWKQVHRRKEPRWHQRRYVRLGALAASVALVLTVMLIVSDQAASSNDSMQGTALGSFSWALVILAAGIGVVMVSVWFWRRKSPRRRK